MMGNYLVFARTEYDEPLTYRGGIEAANDEEAGKLAVENFGGDWLEMTLVPEAEVHWVQREEAEVEA